MERRIWWTGHRWPVGGMTLSRRRLQEDGVDDKDEGDDDGFTHGSTEPLEMGRTC